MPPRVSVIIPAFNAALFVADAIHSVLAQSCDLETEIIVVDDGSSDGTSAVVSEISSRHRQVVLLSNQRRKGPSGARNTGLLNATGQYVAFLDADDLWCPNHLQEGIGFLERHRDIDVVFYNFAIYEFETKRRLGDWFSLRSFTRTLKVDELDGQYSVIRDDLFHALLDESFVHLPAMIVRSTVLHGELFNEGLKRSEDRDFAIRLAVNSKARFAFNSLVTGKYFRHGDSLTSKSVENALSMASDHIDLFTEYLSKDSLDAVTVSKLQILLYDAHMRASHCYRQLNSHGLAIAALFKSLRYNVASSQFKELAKIAASSVIYHVFRHTTR